MLPYYTEKLGFELVPEEIEEYATARSALAIAPQASGSPCDGSARESVATCQQPGSPLLPQQLLLVRILVQLLAKMRVVS